MLLWLNIEYAVNWWLHLIYSLVDLYMRKSSLNPRYIMNFYTNREKIYKLVYTSDKACVAELRMNRHTFTKLCSMLQNLGGLKHTKNMLIDEQVAMFLHILAHHVKNRTIIDRFNRSAESISRHFHNVLNGVIRLQGQLLKNPEPILANSTTKRWKWFEVHTYICILYIYFY